MAKSFIEELTGYRVKVEKDGKEIVNVPGILAFPILLAAPKAGILGMAAAPLLGCSIHLENETGKDVDFGKAVKNAADNFVNTAENAAKSVKETIEKGRCLAYSHIQRIKFEGKYFRNDIGLDIIRYCK